jgi:hypothetical protein
VRLIQRDITQWNGSCAASAFVSNAKVWQSICGQESRIRRGHGVLKEPGCDRQGNKMNAERLQRVRDVVKTTCDLCHCFASEIGSIKTMT